MNHQQTVPSHPINPEILVSLNGLPIRSPQHSQSVPAEQMLYRLARFFRQYLHCSAEQLAVLSLWTLHTHCFSAARSSPYLNVCSRRKQSGKSLCLELLSLVCADSWFATGVSAGALARKVVSARPTVLLDECQTIFGASDKSVRGLLLSGCKRGAVYEISGRGLSPAHVADVFCPKAFAGMTVLPPAIEDRSIPIVLKAARQGKTDAAVRRFVAERAREEAAPLVAWLKQWTAHKRPDIPNVPPYPRDRMPAELNLRQQDCVEPLLHLADLIGGQVPQEARAALVKLFCHDSSEGFFAQLLSDIREAFAKNSLGDRIPTNALLYFLNSLESRPWRTWRDGEPMTPIELARILRPLGINPANIRIRRYLVVKGYYTRDFVPHWRQLDEVSVPCK